MDIETKLEIIKSPPTEEIVTEEALRGLLETNASPRHYFGLEISGMLHIGHVLVGCKKINDIAKIGGRPNILLADWHSFANGKLDGDWDKIIKGAELYRRIFSIASPDAKIILGSDLYSDFEEYWKDVMKLAAKTTIARATRTLIIEGRSEKDTLHVSQYLYPIMQAADILALDVDIPHAGMDQRRVHMLAKELFKAEGMREIVPLHHHLLASLVKPAQRTDTLTKEKEELVAEMKMSKSKPGSAISVIATNEEISKIIGGAWCPDREEEGNPILELCKYVIMPAKEKLDVKRDKRFGGDIQYSDYKSIASDYVGGTLHPSDLKLAVAGGISELVGRIRDKLDNNRDRELIKVFEGRNKG